MDNSVPPKGLEKGEKVLNLFVVFHLLIDLPFLLPSSLGPPGEPSVLEASSLL